MDWVTYYGISYLNTEKLLNAKEELFYTIMSWKIGKYRFENQPMRNER